MDQYEDQSKDILNSILKEELSDSDSGALIEELQLYEQTRFCYWNKGAVKQQWCIKNGVIQINILDKN